MKRITTETEHPITMTGKNSGIKESYHKKSRKLHCEGNQTSRPINPLFGQSVHETLPVWCLECKSTNRTKTGRGST